MRRSILAISFLLASPLSAAAAEPPLALDLGVEMYAAGLHALSIDLSAELEGPRYRVEGRAQTRGLMDVLFRWRSTSQSGGRLGRDGEIFPELHRVQGEMRWGARETVLRYDPEGRVQVRVTPPPEKERRKPVPPELAEDTLDTLSAALLALREAKPENACRRSAPVFDGRRRYDVRFEPVGPDVLKPSQYAMYAGPALKCRVEIVRIRGFQDDGELDEKPRKGATWVWYARLPQAPVALPVRLEIETEYGYGIGHLVRAEARGGARTASGG